MSMWKIHREKEGGKMKGCKHEFGSCHIYSDGFFDKGVVSCCERCGALRLHTGEAWSKVFEKRWLKLREGKDEISFWML